MKLNYDFKTLKNQANVTFTMVHVIVITPHDLVPRVLSWLICHQFYCNK